MSIVESPETRVARGAELLDRVRPGWAEAVSLDRLAMKHCNWCVLGQVYGHYVNGLCALDIGQRDTDEIDYGFNASIRNKTSRNLSEYPKLASLWRAEIRARLTPAAVALPDVNLAPAFTEMATV